MTNDEKFEYIADKLEVVGDMSNRLSTMETKQTKHIAYFDGLELNPRMKVVEQELHNKATWNGLRWSVGIILAIATLAVTGFAAFK